MCMLQISVLVFNGRRKRADQLNLSEMSIQYSYKPASVLFSVSRNILHQGPQTGYIFAEIHSHPERGMEMPRNLPCQGLFGRYFRLCLQFSVNFPFVLLVLVLWLWFLFGCLVLCCFFFRRLSRIGGGLSQT